MSLWAKWIRIRENMEDPASAFKFDDMGQDNGHVQQEIMKTVFAKYPEETMSFLSNIANRGDAEIGSLLRKLQRSPLSLKSSEPQHPNSDERIVHPSFSNSDEFKNG